MPTEIYDEAIELTDTKPVLEAELEEIADSLSS